VVAGYRSKCREEHGRGQGDIASPDAAVLDPAFDESRDGANVFEFVGHNDLHMGVFQGEDVGETLASVDHIKGSGLEAGEDQSFLALEVVVKRCVSNVELIGNVRQRHPDIAPT
jgi:hypothetical protein